MSGQAIATVGMLFIWSVFLAGMLWLCSQPKRKANAALAHLNGSLGLTLATTGESLWRATREQFNWTSWPLLRGSRGGYQVEVTTQPALRWHSTLTTVVVSGPESVSGRVQVSRQPEMLTFSKDALNPIARTVAPRQGGDLASFIGNARIFYDRAALERLLSEPVRGKVLELPRHWMNIGVDGSTMLIAWWGVESDPAVVEQAFRIGEECLKLIIDAASDPRRTTPIGGAPRPRSEPTF